MKYQHLIVLLPCNSLEDFPTQYHGDDAQGLLAAWSALWHPALVAAAQAKPIWFRVSSPPDLTGPRAIVIPTVSESELAADYPAQAQATEAVVIRHLIDRQEIIQTALDQLDGGDAGVDPALAQDFLALGYGFLQVELLTRQMRYSSNLDQYRFETHLVAAANLAVQGDAAGAREKLGVCFDSLAEARDYYYPMEAFLLDLTMVAPTTIGAPLRDELARPTQTNILLSSSVLEAIAQREPETLAALQQAATENRLALVGGEQFERRLPLLACESLLAEFERGLVQSTLILGRRPAIFGRWRFGLVPLLPQLLQRLGYQGAVHATFEEGAYPEGSQVKIRWEGCDGTALDAIARPPADATKSATFLKFSLRMGESMDMDHVATTCLAHWAGQTSVWHEDVRRIAKYSRALGKFVSLEDYFRSTTLSMNQQRFQIDQYRSPYLRQAVAKALPDPISTVVRYWRRRAVVDSAQAICSLASFASGRLPPLAELANAAPDAPATAFDQVDQLATQVDQAEEVADAGDLDARLQGFCEHATEQLAQALPRAAAAPGSGYLLVNPLSFPRRVGLEVPQLPSLPEVSRPVYAAAATSAARYAVVDVPSMGYAWISAGPAPAAAKPEPLIADECLLHNEFFEALIDPRSGGLRALRPYNSRHNRISQQLAYRWLSSAAHPEPDGVPVSDRREVYSVMACDAVETTLSTPVLGEIQTRGRLLDRGGKTLAAFRQTFRLWRGSRVLQLQIQLEPHIECSHEPWECYYAARFAWANESAELYRAVNQTRQPTSAQRLEAPLYLDILDGEARTTILTGGIPFHRRHGGRQLDTLLIVRGERCRQFELGLGFDLKQPQQEAWQLLAPPPVLCQHAAPPAPKESWLFHIDARNVQATHWEPLLEEGVVAGFRVRLLEVSGRPAKATISAFRPVVSACKLNFLGQPDSTCLIHDGRPQLQLSGHEWVELEARW